MTTITKLTPEQKAAAKAEWKAEKEKVKATLKAKKGKKATKGAPPKSPILDAKAARARREKIIDQLAKIDKEPVEPVVGKIVDPVLGLEPPLRKAPKAKAKKVDAAEVVTHVPTSTVQLNTNVAPSVEIAQELQAAFDHFNHKLFDNNLEPVVFSNCRLKKSLGYFWPKQWARRSELKGRVHEIGLDFARLHDRGDRLVLSTLVHEMCHLQIEQLGRTPKGGYHCKYWAAAMFRVGLEPIALSAKGVPTGKLTGPNATHEIMADGSFDRACHELLDKGFQLSWASQPVEEPAKKPSKKKKAGAKAKHTCPLCKANAWGKPSMILTCTGDQDNRHEPTEMQCDRGEYEGDEDTEE